MAKENWRRIGVIVSFVDLLVIVVGGAWAGGGRVTGVEKDIKRTDEKVEENRKSNKDTQALVFALTEKQAEDYKELSRKDSEAELRDARSASQYALILTHMQRQTEHDKAADGISSQMLIDVSKMQVKLESLTKD